MGANNALINAASRLGQSQAGVSSPNLKPKIDADRARMKKSLGMITGVMGRLEKEEDELMAGKELASKKLKDVLDVGMKQIHGLKLPLPQEIIKAVRNDIKRLQEEFETVNTYGKNDTEENNNTRNRIEGELARIINGAKTWRTGIGILAAGKDNFNLAEIEYGNLDSATMALDVENMDENVRNGYAKIDLVKGNIRVQVKKLDGTFKDWTMESLTERLNIKKTGWDADEVKVYNGLTTRAESDFKNKVNNFDIDEEAAQIAGTIKDENDFKNIAKRDIEGLGINFKKALLQSGLIQTAVMENMFLDGEGGKQPMSSILEMLDSDGDGDVDDKDAEIAGSGGKYTGGVRKGQDIDEDMWLDNSRKMIDAITSTEAPGFDLSVSTELMSDYFALMRKQKYDNQYNKLSVAEEAKETSKNQNIVLGTYRTYSEQDAVLDKATKGEPINDWAGNEWVLDPDVPGNYKFDDDTSYPLNKLLKGPQFGMTERIDQRKLDYSEKVEFETYDPEAEGLGTMDEPYKHSVLGPTSPVRGKWYHMNAEGTLPMMWDGKRYRTKEQFPISPK